MLLSSFVCGHKNYYYDQMPLQFTIYYGELDIDAPSYIYAFGTHELLYQCKKSVYTVEGE